MVKWSGVWKSNRRSTIQAHVSSPLSHGSSSVWYFAGLSLLLSACPMVTEEPTPTPDASPAPVPSGKEVIETVLVPSCGFSSCHGSSSGGLTLTNSSAYANLVNQASSQIPDMLRVKPGKPEESYLYWKLIAHDGIVGDEMPPGGSLTAANIEFIAEWIAGGAPE